MDERENKRYSLVGVGATKTILNKSILAEIIKIKTKRMFQY